MEIAIRVMAEHPSRARPKAAPVKHASVDAEVYETLLEQNLSLKAQLDLYQRALATVFRMGPIDILTRPGKHAEDEQTLPEIVWDVSDVRHESLYGRVFPNGDGTYCISWCKLLNGEWKLAYPGLKEHGTGVSLVTAAQLATYGRVQPGGPTSLLPRCPKDQRHVPDEAPAVAPVPAAVPSKKRIKPW